MALQTRQRLLPCTPPDSSGTFLKCAEVKQSMEATIAEQSQLPPELKWHDFACKWPAEYELDMSPPNAQYYATGGGPNENPYSGLGKDTCFQECKASRHCGAVEWDGNFGKCTWLAQTEEVDPAVTTNRIPWKKLLLNGKCKVHSYKPSMVKENVVLASDHEWYTPTSTAQCENNSRYTLDLSGAVPYPQTGTPIGGVYGYSEHQCEALCEGDLTCGGYQYDDTTSKCMRLPQTTRIDPAMVSLTYGSADSWNVPHIPWSQIGITAGCLQPSQPSQGKLLGRVKQNVYDASKNPI